VTVYFADTISISRKKYELVTKWLIVFALTLSMLHYDIGVSEEKIFCVLMKLNAMCLHNKIKFL
jgi:hypothetical protein